MQFRRVCASCAAVMHAAGSSVLRQVFVVAALAAALVAQQLTFAKPYAVNGWALFGAAGVLIVWAVERGYSSAKVSDVSVKPSPSRLWRLFWSLGTIAAVGLTTQLSAGHRWPVLVLALWVLSWSVGAVALRGWHVSPAMRPPIPWTVREAVALNAVVAGAAIVRLLWIDSLPRYFFGDESRVGMFLANAYRGGIPNFFTMGWNTWPVIGLSMQGLFVPLLGFSHSTLRVSSALMGTLAVGATYLLARELFTPRVALIAAVLLAMCRTAIDFSRLGVCHAQVIFLAPFAFFWWWRAVNTGRAGSYWWTGVALGLCLYSYNAGQLLPVLWIGWVILCAALGPRNVRAYWRGALITLTGFFTTVMPWLYYATDHFSFGPNWAQWTIMARNRQVMTQVLEAWRLGGWLAAAPIVKTQAWSTWLGFTVLPAGAYGLGYRGGGMLDHITAPLFVLGLLLAATRWRGREGFLPYWWIVTAVSGGVLTIDPPAVVRLVGILPALAILAALPLDGLLRASQPGRVRTVIGVSVVAGLLAAAGWQNWRTYFVDFARAPIDDTSELARHVQRLPANTVVFLVGAEHFLHFTHDANCEIFPFEFPNRRLEDVPDPAALLPLHQPIDAPLEIILGPSQATLVPYIRDLYPHTAVRDVMYGTERLLFRSLSVEADDIRARSGLQRTVSDAQGAVVSSGVADPFAATLPPPQAGQRVRWSGSLYWPTDQPTALSVQSGKPLTVRIGGETIAEPGTTGSSDRQLVLPRGWHPLSIDEGDGAGGWSMTIPGNGAPLAVTRWDLRPDASAEGLSAVYERPGMPSLRTIDPQVNAFAVEEFYRLARQPTLVSMPFSATWEGALRIVKAGKYQLEVHGSGPYTLWLDGTPLLKVTSVVPEEPIVASAVRDVAPGLHPLTVLWDSTRPAHTSRRLLQLYWTPPDGERELIPPSSFVPPNSAR